MHGIECEMGEVERDAMADVSEKPATGELIEGWGWPGNARKAHYFLKSRSICNKWLSLTRLYGDSRHLSESDLCKACLKRKNTRTWDARS